MNEHEIAAAAERYYDRLAEAWWADDERTPEEIEQQAVDAKLATRLCGIGQTDGRAFLVEAISEAESDWLRGLCDLIREGADHAEIGKMVSDRVRAYAVSCAEARGVA